MHVVVRRALGDRYCVTCVESVQEATEKLKSAHFDLLILDLTLTDGDGFQYVFRLDPMMKPGKFLLSY